MYQIVADAHAKSTGVWNHMFRTTATERYSLITLLTSKNITIAASTPMLGVVDGTRLRLSNADLLML